jgi:hypothetical protein
MLAFLFAAATLAPNTVYLPKTAVCDTRPAAALASCVVAKNAYQMGPLVGVDVLYGGGKLYLPHGTKCSQQATGQVCVMPTPSVMPKMTNRPG